MRFACVFLLYFASSENIQKYETPESCEESYDHFTDTSKTVHLAVVACGDRAEETMVMVKSALMLGSSPLSLYIFAEDQLQTYFIQNCEFFKLIYGKRFKYEVHPIFFPRVEDDQEWKDLFKLCASQRLFIPDILKKTDSLIYVDTDILFLSPIEELWSFFEAFDEHHIAGLSPEHEDFQASWYPRFARHPFVPPLGVNSGVMLMNLTRMRRHDWLKELMDFQRVYKYNITWGDQDLLNIYFHKHADQLFQFTCAWNYRLDHCMYMSNCASAEFEGVSVLHGNRHAFHNEKFPSIKAFYEAIKEYDIGKGRLEDLKKAISSNTAPHLSTNCGKVTHIITKKLYKFIG